MQSLNPQTHPGFIYVVCQGAGIISIGRPIRGNFYCFKLDEDHEEEVRRLFDGPGSCAPETLEYLNKHERRWSHRIDHEGREE